MVRRKDDGGFNLLGRVGSGGVSEEAVFEQQPEGRCRRDAGHSALGRAGAQQSTGSKEGVGSGPDSGRGQAEDVL